MACRFLGALSPIESMSSDPQCWAFTPPSSLPESHAMSLESDQALIVCLQNLGTVRKFARQLLRHLVRSPDSHAPANPVGAEAAVLGSSHVWNVHRVCCPHSMPPQQLFASRVLLLAIASRNEAKRREGSIADLERARTNLPTSQCSLCHLHAHMKQRRRTKELNTYTRECH